MPQLNPEFFLSQIFWLILTYSFLFIFLWRISLPRITKVIERRENKINSNLEEAKNLQANAERIEKDLEETLKKENNKAENKLNNSINSFKKEMEKKISLLDKELEESLLKANKKILQIKEESLKDIQKQIKPLVSLTIQKLIEINLDDKNLEDIINKTTSDYREFS